MVKSKKFWIWCSVGSLAVLAAWAGWVVWQVNRDLSASITHAEAIQNAVESGDDTRLKRELAELQKTSSSAAARTSGSTWSILTQIPLLGDDAEGIEVASNVLDVLAREGIQPLADASDRFEELLPRSGGVDITAVQAMAEPTSAAYRAFAEADAALSGVEVTGFVSTLATRFAELQAKVSSAASSLKSAEVATSILPQMLGAEGPKHHLLIFQNNAEVRATGGLAGAASLVEARDGKVNLRNHVAGSEFGETSRPVLPLDKSEQDLYGDVLGTYFLNAGMTPDVSRASELLKERWEQRYPRRRLDGVLLVDAVTISYMLEATGPINVGGRTLDAKNVVDELLHNVYLRLPSNEAQDRFFAEVTRAAFVRFSNGVENPESLITSLVRAVQERRLFVHSFDPEIRERLAGSDISGGLEADPRGSNPSIVVTLNDTTGAKMSYFLRYDLDVTPTSCVGGIQSYSVKARMRSTAPRDAASLPAYITGDGKYGVPPGSQIVTVRIYSSPGGKIGKLYVNGARGDLVSGPQAGRIVGTTYIQLDPGQTVDLTWTMKSGVGQTSDTKVWATPTVEREKNSQMRASACK
ncbi:DUF4012 domain-containing protein [Nocardioides sp. zg-ZUI104]|uniref:DUF4012 domain-containing protein n=1 Tax=Nocardioides faecalis TaxID=2803858 RepID=UPI001BCB2272|nr:DUF4012 domain-containing protein [Nocardioides faecalis]MBS4753299.1 DUF4012 domain-containing protein [Nocardioides faecalis]